MLIRVCIRAFMALLVVVSGAIALSYQPIDVSLLPSGESTFALIDRYYAEPFMLEHLDITCDVAVSPYEWAHLLDLPDGAQVTAQKLKRVCWHLQQKRKFDSVRINAQQQGQRCRLSLMLSSRWTFSRIKCKGILLDAEQYHQAYGLQSGTFFTLTDHEHGIKAVKQELYNNGFFDAQVTDYLAYEKETKTVQVTVSVEQAHRFSVTAATCSVTGHTDAHALKEALTGILNKELVGQYYSLTELNRALEITKKHIINAGYLDHHVSVKRQLNRENRTVELICVVTLKGAKRYLFKGNHFFSQEQLLRQLLLVDTTTYVIPPALAVQDIKNVYAQYGFWQAHVTFKERPDLCVVTIVEGERSSVAQVAITGSAQGYKGPEEKTFFDQFLAQSSFEENRLQVAINQLKQAYIKQGFWACVIKEPVYKPLDQGSFAVTIALEPGAQRKLVGVHIKGTAHLEHEEPFDPYTRLNEPIAFDKQILEDQQRWLMDYMHAKGFLYARIYPECKEVSGGLLLIWHIDTVTTQPLFGKTIIQGSNNVDPYILLRELSYKPGELYDPEKVQQTLKRLKALGLFESLSLVPVRDPIEPGSTDQTMVLAAVPDYPYEVRARAGLAKIGTHALYQGYTTYTLGGTFLWKNVTGAADQIRFDGDITRFTRNITLSYQRPWLGQWPLLTLVQGYSNIYEQPLLGTGTHSLYTATTNGAQVQLSYDTGRGALALAGGVETMKLSGISKPLAKKIDFEPQLVDKHTPYLWIEPTYTYERLDNKFNPTRGFATLLSLKAKAALGVPLGSFVKLVAEQSVFWPLYKNSVIGALRVRLGHILYQNFKTIMPGDRFYLGGPQSLRGYEPLMVPPITALVGENNRTSWVPVGGKSMVALNTELRFPLYPNLTGVLFNDMGVLAQDVRSTINGDRWIGASGFGLRYATPLGPLRFDIGWKWRRQDPRESRYAWCLTLGHAF